MGGNGLWAQCGGVGSRTSWRSLSLDGRCDKAEGFSERRTLCPGSRRHTCHLPAGGEIRPVWQVRNFALNSCLAARFFHLGGKDNTDELIVDGLVVKEESWVWYEGQDEEEEWETPISYLPN